MFAFFSFHKTHKNVPLVLLNVWYFLYQIIKFYFNEKYEKNDVDF